MSKSLSRLQSSATKVTAAGTRRSKRKAADEEAEEPAAPEALEFKKEEEEEETKETKAGDSGAPAKKPKTSPRRGRGGPKRTVTLADLPEDEPDDGAEIPDEPAESWNQNLVALLLYKSQFKSMNVSATTDSDLRTWVDIQRKLYRRFKTDSTTVTPLQAKQLTVLEAVDFPFTVKGALHWDRFFEKFQEFQAKHGHALVPRLCEFPGLGDWVVEQRRHHKLLMQGKSSGLDTERLKKLEDLGMVWNVRNRPEWNSRYDQLLEYKKKFGDTKVPQHYKGVKGLGKWVAKQREQYRLKSQGKHSFLTEDRLEKLNEVGFVWTVRSMNKDEETPGDAKTKEEKATVTQEV